MQTRIDHCPNETCPECGAPKVDGMNCWEQMGAVCAWEWQDPELAALHFVTVASYNLQHPEQFSDEAISRLRELYVEHLDKGLAVTEIRRRVGEAADGNVKVLRPEGKHQPVLRSWEMTLADVYLPDIPQGAAQRVREWAKAIRRELCA